MAIEGSAFLELGLWWILPTPPEDAEEVLLWMSPPIPRELFVIPTELRGGLLPKLVRGLSGDVKAAGEAFEALWREFVAEEQGLPKTLLGEWGVAMLSAAAIGDRRGDLLPALRAAAYGNYGFRPFGGEADMGWLADFPLNPRRLLAVHARADEEDLPLIGEEIEYAAASPTLSKKVGLGSARTRSWLIAMNPEAPLGAVTEAVESDVRAAVMAAFRQPVERLTHIYDALERGGHLDAIWRAGMPRAWEVPVAALRERAERGARWAALAMILREEDPRTVVELAGLDDPRVLLYALRRAEGEVLRAAIEALTKIGTKELRELGEAAARLNPNFSEDPRGELTTPLEVDLYPA